LYRFLVRRERILVRSKPLTFPKSSVQIQNHTGSAHELGIPWEKPVAVSPRLESILTEKTSQTGMAETSQAFFLDNHSTQVCNRESAERQFAFPERLADNRGDLGSFSWSIRHRSPTSRQVLQGFHGSFRAASQKSFPLIQHCLFTTSQDICRGCNGFPPVSQQDNQNANHQTGTLVSFLLCLAQRLFFLAAELDSIFVRFASDGTESSYFGMTSVYPKNL